MENMNERTNAEHIAAQALETVLVNKVDKEVGKGLSSNDYTDAEKEKLAGLENYTLPDFTYRNLCMNSRGDNLNCWRSGSSYSTLKIDTAQFGYPVIKLSQEDALDRTGYYCQMVSVGDNVCDNYPALLSMCSRFGGTGLTYAITLSLDCYPNKSAQLSYKLTGGRSDLKFPITADKWNKVSIIFPAGYTVDVFKVIDFGDDILPTLGSDFRVYVKNIQIEYGTEATPYCYNSTLPFSLEEQIVPGELWDGKQVYVRSFKGKTPASLGTVVTLMTGIDSIVETRASIATPPYNSVPPASIYDLGTITMDLLYLVYSADSNAYLSPYGSRTFNTPYTVTMKYTKA